MIKIKKFSKKQKATAVILAVQAFTNGMLISLQAPFYTSVAASKGARPSEYGFVFGSYYFTQFIMSPIYGQFIHIIGVKYLISYGNALAGISCILFGSLIYVENKNTFIVLSFIVRIGEALGCTAFKTAFFSVIEEEFPENTGAALSTLQSMFPLGLLIGPTIGGIMYEFAGYVIPFVSFGLFFITVGVTAYFSLPSYQTSYQAQNNQNFNPNILEILKLPEASLAMFSAFVVNFSLNFYNVTLEPHLEQFHLSPSYVGLMFANIGVAQFFSANITGRILDKGISPRTIIIVSCFLDMLSFTLVGPAPFLNFKPSLPVIAFALALHGVGFATKHLPSIGGCQKDVVKAGFPSGIDTSGKVAGLWSTFYSAGALIGSVSSGFLLEHFGFQKSCMVIVALQVVLLVASISVKTYRRINPLSIVQYDPVSTADNE